jgi:hypothetical protein
VRRLLPAALLVAVTLALGSGGATGAAALPVYAGQCGLGATQPLWFDFGYPTPEFNSIFGHAGVALGVSGVGYPATMRAAGAATVYFDLHLNNRIGTPTKPADPSTLAAKAKTFFAAAADQTGCQAPVIVENELAGPALVTPWSDTNAQYRSNALIFLQQLASLGAHPVLLIPARPYTGGDARTWWQQVAAVAEIVREDYVPATTTWKFGAVLGSRNLRNAYRQAVSDLTSIGIPPNRVGLMVSFASTPGFGGRSGLASAESWFQVVKWEALAARQVAAETGIASVWSWGWGEWSVKEQDPDKPGAACVWLWARASQCDAPGMLGTSFEASTTEGQLSGLGTANQCLIGTRALSNAAIAQLQQLTGDRETAYSALFERLVESPQAPVASADVLAAERAVVAQAFGGSRAAYLAALAQAHANVSVARAILGDQLRRARIEPTLASAPPPASDVQTFYDSFPDLQVRSVRVLPQPAWVGATGTAARGAGLALSQVAPDSIFTLPTGRTTMLRTSVGTFQVTPLDDPLPLGAVPLGRARTAIVAALRGFERGAAFEQWTVSRQRSALNGAICARDDLPQPGAVDLTAYLQFLRLG